MRNVPLVIMVTLRYQEDGATHVSVTEILTCRTPNHATPALVPVSNACFTPMAMRASIVDVVTMEMPVHRSAGVSMQCKQAHYCAASDWLHVCACSVCVCV